MFRDDLAAHELYANRLRYYRMSDVTIEIREDEMPAEIAGLEYDNTIMKLETDGNMAAANVVPAVQLSLDLAKLGGLKDIVPAEDVISTKFRPVPTKP